MNANRCPKPDNVFHIDLARECQTIFEDLCALGDFLQGIELDALKMLRTLIDTRITQLSSTQRKGTRVEVI